MPTTWNVYVADIERGCFNIKANLGLQKNNMMPSILLGLYPSTLHVQKMFLVFWRILCVANSTEDGIFFNLQEGSLKGNYFQTCGPLSSFWRGIVESCSMWFFFSECEGQTLLLSTQGSLLTYVAKCSL